MVKEGICQLCRFARDWQRSAKRLVRISLSNLITSINYPIMDYGAYKSSRIEENISRIDEFAANNTVLVPTAVTAREYGDIKNKLLKKGRPIPENDIWIVSIAKQYILTSATRDDHFKKIDKLRIVTW